MQWEPAAWRQEKNRTSKKDLATNIPGTFIRDASQLEWCSQSGPVMKVGGNVSSPSAPAGVEGSKSK